MSLSKEHGASLISYSLLVSFIALIVIASVKWMGLRSTKSLCQVSVAFDKNSGASYRWAVIKDSSGEAASADCLKQAGFGAFRSLNSPELIFRSQDFSEWVLVGN